MTNDSCTRSYFRDKKVFFKTVCIMTDAMKQYNNWLLILLSIRLDILVDEISNGVEKISCYKLIIIDILQL